MELIGNGINALVALATIGLGLFGWLRVHTTMDFVGLRPADNSGLGKSEIRAASGAVWVGVGSGALLLFSPIAFLMLAFVYVGAAIGRATAVVVDHARSEKPLFFLGFEVACAALLLVVNVPAAL
ncbi:MAG: DUF4345 family protein [Cohaesibacteraceae bacterium]